MARISRRLSFILAALILVGFFSATFALSTLTREQSIRKLDNNPVGFQAAESENSNESEKPTGSVVLEKFHRSQTKPNGQKEWEITADVGEYLPQTSVVRITNGTLLLFKADGSQTKLIAPKAELILSGTDLTEARCSGGVKIEHKGDTTISSETITYGRVDGRVVAPSRVIIENSSGTTSADSMQGNVETRIFQLLGSVRTEIRPQNKGMP